MLKGLVKFYRVAAGGDDHEKAQEALCSTSWNIFLFVERPACERGDELGY
jgi:hypothetical protein